MRFKTAKGGSAYKAIHKFLIDWDGGSRSKMQKKVKDFVRPFWENDLCYEEMVLAGSRLSLDLVNITKDIAIEVHGGQHEKFTPFFQKGRGAFIDQIKRDEEKVLWCNNNHITLVEIYERDLEKISKLWFWEQHRVNL